MLISGTVGLEAYNGPVRSSSMHTFYDSWSFREQKVRLHIQAIESSVHKPVALIANTANHLDNKPDSKRL